MKKEVYEKLAEITRNNEYKTGNLLVYLYHQNYYKLTSIDLSTKANKFSLHKINFIGKSGENDSATMLFSAKTQQITTLNFSLYSLNITK